MPLNHNSSKPNFYNDHEDHGSAGDILNRRCDNFPIPPCPAASTVSGYTEAVSGYTEVVSSPYSGQARLMQQSYHGSPHIQNK